MQGLCIEYEHAPRLCAGPLNVIKMICAGVTLELQVGAGKSMLMDLFYDSCEGVVRALCVDEKERFVYDWLFCLRANANSLIKRIV